MIALSVYCAHVKPEVLWPALVRVTLTFIRVFLFVQSAIRCCIAPCTRSWKHPRHFLVDVLQTIWPFVHRCGICLGIKLLKNSRWVRINFAMGELLGCWARRKPANVLYMYMDCQFWLMIIWHTCSHWINQWLQLDVKMEAWFPSCTEYASNWCRYREKWTQQLLHRRTWTCTLSMRGQQQVLLLVSYLVVTETQCKLTSNAVSTVWCALCIVIFTDC